MKQIFNIDPTLRRAYAYVVRNEAQGKAFVCRFDDIPEQGIIIAWHTTHAEAEQHAQSLRHIPKEPILSKLINWCRRHLKHRPKPNENEPETKNERGAEVDYRSRPAFNWSPDGVQKRHHA